MEKQAFAFAGLQNSLFTWQEADPARFNRGAELEPFG